MNHTGYHTPHRDLVILGKVNVCVLRILRLQERTPSLNLVAPHRELAIDARDDNLVLVVGEAPINDEHILIVDPPPVIESPLVL